MTSNDGYEIGLTAGSVYDQSVESEVFETVDATFRPVDLRSRDEIVDRLAGVDAVIDRLNTVSYPSDVVRGLAAEGCRALARCGIGVDMIDHETAAEHGLWVVNVPEYCQEEVAEHTLLLMLALQRDLVSYHRNLKEGRWDRRLMTGSVHRMSARTVGLVGFGSIARRVAERVNALGMDVLAADPYVDAEEMAEYGVEKCDRPELLETSDIASAHVPLTERTRGMFDSDAFERMKETAYLVNVSRGGLVDEDALATALEEGELAGAALDVHADEPADQLGAGEAATFESPLRDRDDVLLTPHVAWFSREAEEAKRRIAAEDVRRILEGRGPEHPVNDPS